MLQHSSIVRRTTCKLTTSWQCIAYPFAGTCLTFSLELLSSIGLMKPGREFRSASVLKIFYIFF
ncbi:hypothetical protein AUEXF2481DRAFT_107018 [Aureobasidium subglaciale EXF-2481]|uniref:Uncharacterized protein n=1 Tax=Aureobasidium subglaciale (strain EXF-2481) TaxID=1043005 RepID=A0A074ZCB7_AURSE|nr:uncharacterized protein AUEXF2481DRAFT_107018 [Aureobasidium subglaciale EXF-2481]KEQ96356.1 hypothetical protein AUEXF2481DRAFT_107018 [Aureobasidium subglaciale EXF-2481]